MNFGEKSFNELKRMTGINPVTLSKKLGALRAQGYVASKPSGVENHYFVTKQADDLKPFIRNVKTLVLAVN